jgi:hypothetical protein
MSLANLVLRNLTVLALIDKTLAGREVRSSLLMPIDEMADAGMTLPVLAIFTDTSKTDAEHIEGRDMIGAMSTVTIGFEMAVFTAPAKTDQNGADIFIPESDEGFETTLDIMQRQIFAELQTGSSALADLWRRFVLRVVGMSVERGAGIDRGVRFAARRAEVRVNVISDPVPGQPLTPDWNDALTALAANNRTASMAALVRTVATGGVVPPWRTVQGELGLNDAEANAIAIAPFPDGLADDGGIRPANEVAGEDKDRVEVIRVGAMNATIEQGTGSATPLIEPSEPV